MCVLKSPYVKLRRVTLERRVGFALQVEEVVFNLI